ncbi:50S ribosomal protein L1 [Candidatus Altiarchaeota archaeon]
MKSKEEVIKAIEEAIKNSPKRKFKQSLDVSFNFAGVHMEGEHKLNITVFLPKGRGKDVEVGAFVDGDMNIQAKEFSKHVLSKVELESMAKDKRQMRTYANQCYSFISAPDLISVVGKNWGVVLGVRGKMPQPVPPNADIKAAFERVKNTIRIKSRKTPTIHVPVGSIDMDPADVYENIQAVYTAIERVVHEEKIRSAFIKTTMGQAVNLW